MAWFKVDDGFWSHPKTSELSDAATALWVRAGSWSAQHLTEGRVPYSALRFFRARRRSAMELVAAGLWSDAGDAFVFHSWADYQPSRSQVEARREAAKNRVNAWRERQSNGVTDSSHAPESNAAPDPTHPDPSPVSTDVDTGGARKRGTRIPDPFIVTGEMRAWAAERCPGVDVNLSTERFVNYWRAKAGKEATKVDWKRTWNNWLLNDQERAPGSRPSTVEHGRSVDDILRSRQDGTQLRAVGS
jgi:hypothetical protein